MKIDNVVKTVAAGVAVYLVMAACAATSSEHSAGGGTSSGASGAPGGSGGGSLLDVLASPVGEASAAPEAVTEACAKKYVTGSTTYYYAEHAYPGASAADIATSVVAMFPTGNGRLEPGGGSLVTDVYVRDGAATVICGVEGGQPAAPVVFLRR